MHYSDKDLLISVFWHNRFLTGSEYVDWLGGFLKTLQETDACFSKLWMINELKYVPILSDFSDLGEVVAASQPKDWAFKSPDSDTKKFTMSSRPMSSFYNTLTTTLDSDPSGCGILVSAG